MTAPHETDRFRHAATYTVTLMVTVAGGVRPATAHRRAEKVAGQIASAAARLADVVDVHARAGLTGTHGQVLAPRPVRFAAANSGHGTRVDPDRLDRYLDPDHERALTSLAHAEARHREHERADLRRRRAVGCANAGRLGLVALADCPCVYCVPQCHLDALPPGDGVGPTLAPRCICGVRTDTPGRRCTTHQRTPIVVLDEDAETLTLLADGLEAHP